jgi:hypothetical protein
MCLDSQLADGNERSLSSPMLTAANGGKAARQHISSDYTCCYLDLSQLLEAGQQLGSTAGSIALVRLNLSRCVDIRYSSPANSVGEAFVGKRQQ